MADDGDMKQNGPNTCEILSADPAVGEFRRDFICMNDGLHENLQDHPHVLILYVAMVIFVMIFLKMVTRAPRARPGTAANAAADRDDGQSRP